LAGQVLLLALFEPDSGRGGGGGGSAAEGGGGIAREGSSGGTGEGGGGLLSSKGCERKYGVAVTVVFWWSLARGGLAAEK